MLTRNRAKSLLDPRTKILLILTITSVVIGGGNSGLLLIVKPVLTAVPLLLFLAEEQWKAAVTYVFIYSAAYLGELFLVPLTHGFLNFLVVACCGIFSRFMPGIAAGAYLVNSTTVSEFMAAMEHMHLPQKLTIPLSFRRLRPSITVSLGQARFTRKKLCPFLYSLPSHT